MAGTIANSFMLLFPSAGVTAFAWLTARQVTPERDQPLIQRWLISWSIKGLLLPNAIWALMNIGLSWRLGPFMPQIQAAQHAGGPWAAEFCEVMAYGLLMTASYWAAVTLGWFVARTPAVLRPEFLNDFKSLCWTCSLGLIAPAAVVCYFGGWPWVGAAALILVGPIALYSRELVDRLKLPPIYARAVARLKFGKYAEAEWEIIRELEKSEDDFEGWMMLADLYANHFHDLAEAERTVLEICGHPKATPSQVAVALHRLADWHLKLGENPTAARRALQLVVDRLRGTRLARMAQLRLSQIPSTAEELRDVQRTGTIPLPALGDALDRKSDPPASRIERTKAAQLANSYVERLNQNPNNVPVREKLARTFAEQVGRSKLGIEQLELLLGMPDQPEPKRAEWLGLIAAWQFKYLHDLAAGRNTLGKLLKEFPQTPQALAARRRLELMDREGVPESWGVDLPQALPASKSVRPL